MVANSQPRVLFPLVFSFSNVQVRGGDGNLYTYTGQMKCDKSFNDPTLTLAIDLADGSIQVDYSVPDGVENINWDADTLSRDSNGRIISSSLLQYSNCDFSNVSVSLNGRQHKIDGLKFISFSWIAAEFLNGVLENATDWPSFSMPFAIATGREHRLSAIDSGPYTNYSPSVLTKVETSHFSHADYGNYSFNDIDFVDGNGALAEVPSDSLAGFDLLFVNQNTVISLGYWSFLDDDYCCPGWVDWIANKPQYAFSIKLSAIASYWSRSYCGDTCSGSGAWQSIEFKQQDCREDIFTCTLTDVFYVDPITSLVSINDYDRDGSVDEVDLDDDNDGQSDEDETSCGSNSLNASSRSEDTDDDKTPNCVDSDDDNDGVLDTSDAFPLDESESVDSDADGLGDNIEMDVGLDPLDPTDVTGSPREILWRNSETGKNTLWSMETHALVERNSINTVADPDWQVEGIANFSGDSKDEIFFRHQGRGENRLWTIENGVRTSSVAIQAAHPNWFVAAMGDFDADGDTDLLWRNSTNGTNRYWEMDGSRRISSIAVRGVALTWEVAGSGDFDGDGRTDLLWRNKSSGANSLWLMQDQSIKQREQLATVGLSWTIAGIGDFDGDGMDDILWRNEAGWNSIWLMSGVERRSSTAIPTASSGWSPFAVYEMNGDGMADILWRHSNGASRLWLMNSTTRTASLIVNSISDSSWVPVAVGNVSN